VGALGGSGVWLAKTIADLAWPICRCVDEPHPSRAVVRACSRVASRNGAAGYKVMRSSHEPMDIDAGPLLNALPHEGTEVESCLIFVGCLRYSRRLPDF